MPELHDRYVQALQNEYVLRRQSGELHASERHRYATIFIGGGTPTLLAPEALDGLLAFARNLLQADGELTIECNPETVTPGLARQLVDGGVTRVSLGAQSLNQTVLSTLERLAGPDTVRKAVATLRAAGIPLLSLDLIWGVPGQTESQLRTDLSEVIRLGPDHISAYELEVKAGTRLARQHAGWYAGDRAETDEFYEVVIEELGRAGYDWYELANFARAGHQCQHNLGYWRAADYVGLGIGAVGTVDGKRRRNTPGIRRYLGAVEMGEDCQHQSEWLDAETQLHERVMLGLRLAEGVTLSRDELGAVVDPGALALLEAGQMLRTVVGEDETRLLATPAGRRQLNGLLARLLR